jgi:small-conductance mechanosensitive channel
MLSGPALVLTLLAIVCALLLNWILFRDKPRSLTLGILFIGAWFLVTGGLASAGFFSNFAAVPPRLLFALFIPAVVLAIAIPVSGDLREALGDTPIGWLIALQTFRVVVELVLWRGYKSGAIPVQMTFEGRNFDILAGLTAPFAAWLWQRTHNRTFAIAWNIAGIVLLANIIVVAILSTPGRFRVFTDGPPNTLLTHFPFIYLPAVLVPVAYTAHILSLRRLWSMRSSASSHPIATK